MTLIPSSGCNQFSSVLSSTNDSIGTIPRLVNNLVDPTRHLDVCRCSLETSAGSTPNIKDAVRLWISEASCVCWNSSSVIVEFGEHAFTKES